MRKQKENPRETVVIGQQYRTCCDICHIKFGTVFLGTIEVIGCIFVLVSVVQQVIWKSEQSAKCDERFLRDCLIFQFRHFDITLILDYAVIILMICILLCVCLLFCGILSDTACLLVPHIFVQGVFVLFSVGYFIFYAWSYFYGDLYVHKRPFVLQSLIERMWLATILLILAAFQSYLFSAVLRCSMYVKAIEEKRRRRESAFERCSERVRIAKENGLWRTTSWGGGFQQYKGQFDENRPKKEPRNKGFRVQWNFRSESTVDETTEKLKETKQSEKIPLVSTESESTDDRPSQRNSQTTEDSPTGVIRTKQRRRSTQSNTSDLQHSTTSHAHSTCSEPKQTTAVARKISPHKMIDVKLPSSRKDAVSNEERIEAELEVIKAHLESESGVRLQQSNSMNSKNKIVVKRAPLRSYKSVDEDEPPPPTQATDDNRSSTAKEVHRTKRHENRQRGSPVLKKVSITATTFA